MSFYTGKARLVFFQRLGNDWPALADFLDIPGDQQRCFQHGHESRAIWNWLADRHQLDRLPDALRDPRIDRADLADALDQQTHSDRAEFLDRQIQNIQKLGEVDLDERFVSLTLLLDQGEEATGGPRFQAQERERYRSLDEALRDRDETALVVLGPPGCGKSTLLRHYHQVLAPAARAGEGPLPFFVALNRYRRQDDRPLPAPREWLAQLWRQQAGDAAPPLETLLRAGRVVLLLDALNEVPHRADEHIERWQAFLLELVASFPDNRVVFSCRTLDYVSPLSREQVRVPMLRVEPLGDGQMREFLAAHQGPDWAALKDLPQLDLLRLPFYLKLLCESYAATREIPWGRAALITGFVRWAFRRELEKREAFCLDPLLVAERTGRKLTQNRWKDPYELPGGLPVKVLGDLAFYMQGQRDAAENGQVGLDHDEALDFLGEEHGKAVLGAGFALHVLVEDSEDTVLFSHQLIQEYFAARVFAMQPKVELLRVAWRADAVRPTLDEVREGLPDSEPLPLLPGTGWEETAIMAAAMAKVPDGLVESLIKPNLVVAGRAAAEVGVSEALAERLRWALVARSREAEADLRARLVAGFVLGELGDPRFERREGAFGAYLMPLLVEIPGGRYRIGSDEGLYERESPVHEVEISEFSLGQFPVTNAEWALFMESGGYEEERWWETEAAKAWRRGEGTSEGSKEQWRSNRKYIQENLEEIQKWPELGKATSQQIEEWERIAGLDETTFEQELAEAFPGGRYTEPRFWGDQTYNHPTQPVVGICWYEALAYLAWLSAQTGQSFRLPTEAEWESATRGQSFKRYAFGEEFDSARCNTFETHLRSTSPVGVFPGGDTPEGVVNLTGNIWDWTSSLEQPYPYDPADGREDPDDKGRRVLRGGSWDSSRGDARAAFRGIPPPGYRNNVVGLRLCGSSPILKS